MKERSVSREELYGGSSRMKTQDARNVMCSQIKKILVDCLRDKNLVLPVTGVDTKYLGSLPSSTRRRELAEKSGEQADPFPTIMLAIGVTAALTIIVCILLYYICYASSFAAGRNDVKPLLSLTLSDNSSGRYRLFSCPTHLYCLPSHSCLFPQFFSLFAEVIDSRNVNKRRKAWQQPRAYQE